MQGKLCKIMDIKVFLLQYMHTPHTTSGVQGICLTGSEEKNTRASENNW